MRRTEKAELISIILAVLMAAGMIAVSLVSHSIAILAEGTDKVIDILASVAVLIGLRLSMRKTRTFPSGLYKLENVIATGIGILILFSAYELAKESIQRMVSGKGGLDNPWLVIAVMVVVVAVTSFIAWYKGKVAREEHSPSLAADARHSLTDLFASTAIIIGVGLEMAGVRNMDSIAALVVVGFLGWSGVTVSVQGIKVLLDASTGKEVLEKAREIAAADPRVRRVVDVQGRDSGSFRFLELSLVPVDYDLRTAEEMSEDLRAAIREEVGNVDEVIVDLSVDTGEGLICAVLPTDEDGRHLAVEFAGAWSLELLEIDASSGLVVSRQRLANPVGRDAHARGARLAVFLARRGVQALIIADSDLDAGAFDVLDANGVSVLSLPSPATVEEAERALPGFVASNGCSK